MADVTYPEGMTKGLAGRLYGGADVDVDWAADDSFTYDEARSECREWVERGTASMSGGRYDTGEWPRLVNVIRRGTDNSVRVFQFSDGTVFEQET